MTRCGDPRARFFCDAYGAGGRDRGLLIATAVRRVEELRRITLERAAGASAGDARMWREHAGLYTADIAYRSAASAALSPG